MRSAIGPGWLCCLALSGLLASCGNAFQGPVRGSIQVEQPAEAADAVAFLRCRGGGIHGEIQTDAEDTRVRADGRFAFWGSFTFPTTTRCDIAIRHPRYRTARVTLSDAFSQTLAPIALESWPAFLAAGPADAINPGTHRPWPESEVRQHLQDTQLWLHTFSAAEQRTFARYVPAIHDIYRTAFAHGTARSPNYDLRDLLKSISRIEAATAYPYPFVGYFEAIKQGDAQRVRAFLAGGVLRETAPPSQSPALSLAAGHGQVEVIEVLLAAGEPINVEGCGAPLLAAVGERQWQAAVTLIRAGADVDTRCANRRGVGDALADFARADNLELLALFLDAGVPVDTRTSRNTTALAEAATAGRIRSVKALLARGARADVTTADGTALLDDAVAKGYLDVEQALRTSRLRAGDDAGLSSKPSRPGEMISLPWRRGLPVPYRVHTSFGQVADLAADPTQPDTLWLATRGGLLRVTPRTGERRAWTRVNGLPASAVRTLWFDARARYLWIATTGGLARIALDDLDRVETVGDGEPRSGYASGYLGADGAGNVWYWNERGLYSLRAEASEATRFAFDTNLLGAAATADRSVFFVTDGKVLWRVEPARGNRERVLQAEDLAAHNPASADGLPELRALTLDDRRGHLWIGTFLHGVFRVDLTTGAIDPPTLQPGEVGRCARDGVTRRMHGRVVLAAGERFAHLERCFGRIDAGNRFRALADRVEAGPVADAAGHIWFIAADGFHRMQSNGPTQRYARAEDPIGNPQVTALHVERDRLFVGINNAPMAVLDLASRVWSPITGVRDVQRLRTVAARDELLALGSSRYWWINRDSLASEVLVLGLAGAPAIANANWQDVRDLEYDGTSFWALRNDRRRGGKARVGLHRLSPAGTQRYDAAGHYSLGELVALAQDPYRADRLWLVRKQDRALVDFDKSMATSALLGANHSAREADRALAQAMADRRLRALVLSPNQALDPDRPQLVWELHGSALVVRHDARVLGRWLAALPPPRAIAVTRGRSTTVWVATAEGLVEFPISPDVGFPPSE